MYLLFGEHSVAFWGGLIFLGSLVPAVILFNSRMGKSIPLIAFSSILVVFGVFVERYLIVIPGQTHPPELFPNMEITNPVFAGGIAEYTISFAEVIQAMGILAIICFIFVLGLKLFKMLPTEAKIYK